MKKSFLICIFHCLLFVNVSSAPNPPTNDVSDPNNPSHVPYLLSNAYAVIKGGKLELVYPHPSDDQETGFRQLEDELKTFEDIDDEMYCNKISLLQQFIFAAKQAKDARNHNIIEGVKSIGVSTLFNVLIVPVITDSVPNLSEKFFNKNHCASMISTGAATAVKEIHCMGSPSMKKTVQMGANVAIDTGSQYLGMQAVSVVVSGINYFKNNPIDENSNAILNMQKITGIVLAGTVGTMLKQELSDGCFQRQGQPGQDVHVVQDVQDVHVVHDVHDQE